MQGSLVYTCNIKEIRLQKLSFQRVLVGEYKAPFQD